jgi:hypothetical protein
MALSMKMAVLWFVPCSLVEVYRCFRGVYEMYFGCTDVSEIFLKHW